MARHNVRSPLVSSPRHWVVPVVVLWVLVFGLGVATKVISGALDRQLGLDRALNNAHTGFLDHVALLFDGLDKVPVVAVYVIVLFVVGGFAFGWIRALGAAIVAGLGWLLCLIPKQLIHEERPTVDSVSHVLNAGRATLSYPSGHVVFAVTFTIAVLILVRGVGLRILLGLIGLVFVLVTAWARLYVGAHFPTDIVGAVLAGAAGALLVAGLWNAVVGRLVASRSRGRA